MRRTRYRGIYDLYSSSNVVKVIKSRWMRWALNVARIRERRGTHSVSVWKPKEEKTLRRPRHRWEENYKTDLQEIGWEAWTRLLRLQSGTSVTIFWMWWWTFGLHKMQEISSLAVEILAFQHEVSYTQWQTTVAVLLKNTFTVLLSSP